MSTKANLAYIAELNRHAEIAHLNQRIANMQSLYASRQAEQDKLAADLQTAEADRAALIAKPAKPVVLSAAQEKIVNALIAGAQLYTGRDGWQLRVERRAIRDGGLFYDFMPVNTASALSLLKSGVIVGAGAHIYVLRAIVEPLTDSDNDYPFDPGCPDLNVYPADTIVYAPPVFFVYAMINTAAIDGAPEGWFEDRKGEGKTRGGRIRYTRRLLAAELEAYGIEPISPNAHRFQIGDPVQTDDGADGVILSQHGLFYDVRLEDGRVLSRHMISLRGWYPAL